MEDNREKIKEMYFDEGSEVSGVMVEGYDFDQGVDYKKLIKKFGTMGFQATHFNKAASIVNKMIENNAYVYLGYTSNMVSSGLRDVFRFLVKHNKVNVVVTTTGGIEEDIIKCLGHFVLGEFNTDGKKLREKGINRIGNIFVSNNRYVEFEQFLQPILEELYEEQKKTGKIASGTELIWKLGEKINDEKSIYYWAYKNKIPVICPAINDGAIGDNIYFFKYKHPDFKLDVSEDIKVLNDTSFGRKSTGVIILGSGVIKHSILNANLLRNGADYSVYINNAQEFDGSDAGARPDEAVSWGKIKGDGESIKLFGDATILFPLLVAESFAK
jgi:deoxyhypusine synthase